MWGDSTHDLLLLSVIKILGKLDLKTRDGPGLLRVSPWPALFYSTYKYNLSDSKLFYAKLDIIPFEIYQNSEPPAGRTSGMSGPVQKEPYPGRGRGRPAEEVARLVNISIKGSAGNGPIAKPILCRLVEVTVGVCLCVCERVCHSWLLFKMTVVLIGVGL